MKVNCHWVEPPDRILIQSTEYIYSISPILPASKTDSVYLHFRPGRRIYPKSSRSQLWHIRPIPHLPTIEERVIILLEQLINSSNSSDSRRGHHICPVCSLHSWDFYSCFRSTAFLCLRRTISGSHDAPMTNYTLSKTMLIIPRVEVLNCCSKYCKRLCQIC